jgi:hypothetical protein
VNFSTDNLKARRTWTEIFQALRKNNFKPQFLYSTKLSFITGGIKTLMINRN